MKALQVIILVCLVIPMSAYLYFSFYNLNLTDSDRKKHRKPIQIKTKIYPNYYDDDLHAEWPFITSRSYNQSDLYTWKECKTQKKVNSRGNGEKGTGFVSPDSMKGLKEQLQKENNFNLLASNVISLHRSLLDPRCNECKSLSYPEKLPKASVVIIFHNEAWTTLLRTVWSVIDRSPTELIKKIVLVDDLSTWSSLKRPLDDYIELLPVRITIVRTSEREGLIRARLIGAQHATGSVLIFLDAHMECSEGWLPQVASDRSVISVPLIDSISSDDMKYEFNEETFINGFTWALGFNWMPIPEREHIRTHYDKAAPIRTPTLVGCAFAVDREFFFEIGSYDSGQNIWGAENIEMSLRVWQCGGRMEVIPCSRIGHLYKSQIIAQNIVRVVEVWMSDSKYLFYAVSPGYKNIKSISENKCADINFGDDNSKLALYDCHGQGENQMFAFAKNQMIATQNPEQCIGTNAQLDAVLTVKCMYKESLLWKYNKEKKWLIHVATGYCMQANQTEVALGQCDSVDKHFNREINSIL